MHLTKLEIDKAQYIGNGQSRCILWDDEVSGFGCRIFPGGKKSFVLSYRFEGRQRFYTIGPYGALTLQQARDHAKRLVGEIISGRDPLEARKRESAAETIAELTQAYLERHAKPHKQSWQKDQRKIERYIIPAWGARRAKTIKQADVAALHHEIGKGSIYEANRTLALLSKMFECGRRWGVVPEGTPNPARGIQKFREEKRDRWVTPEEMPRLAQAIGEENNVYVRVALWLYLFTGVRKTELLMARWADVDLQRKCLYLPQTKAGRPHHVPLSLPALTLLQGLPRQEDNPYLLPGKRRGKHLVNISKPWNRVRARARIMDVRLHDLRRTVGSWMAQMGNDIHLIARTLNHSQLSTTTGYARLGIDPIRNALETHSQKVLAATGMTDMGRIVTVSESAS